MRNYLYVWHQPSEKRLVASGIEFRDLVHDLATTGGIVLLRHQFDAPSFDQRSRFEYLPSDSLNQIANDDVYGYGDFCWADFAHGVSLADLSDGAIAELAFFAHAARPLKGADVPGLGNRFLYWAHDDGWYARIYYSIWDSIGPILLRLFDSMMDEDDALRVFERIQSGESAFWCRSRTARECEGSEDIDAIQRKYLTNG